MKTYRLKILLRITRLLERLCWKKILECEVIENYDAIIVHSKVSKNVFRTAVIVEQDSIILGIKTLMYVFNLKPYKL